jgi:hypothetical protein
MKVIDYKISGSSCPIVIKQNSNTLFVKLRAGMSGEHSILSEWFGNSLGQKLGIRTRIPKLIQLDKKLEYTHLNIEIRDLIEKSFGTNICFEYLNHVKEFTILQNTTDFKEIYLFDVLLLNIDRTQQNHNILINENSELIVTDYESSLLFNYSKSILTNKNIINQLRKNPFYSIINENELSNFLYKLKNVNFDNLVQDIPTKIINTSEKEELSGLFKVLQNRDWNLRDLLNLIDSSPIENEAERQLRIRNNRNRFIESINSK